MPNLSDIISDPERYGKSASASYIAAPQAQADPFAGLGQVGTRLSGLAGENRYQGAVSEANKARAALAEKISQGENITKLLQSAMQHGESIRGYAPDIQSQLLKATGVDITPSLPQVSKQFDVGQRGAVADIVAKAMQGYKSGAEAGIRPIGKTVDIEGTTFAVGDPLDIAKEKIKGDITLDKAKNEITVTTIGTGGEQLKRTVDARSPEGVQLLQEAETLKQKRQGLRATDQAGVPLTKQIPLSEIEEVNALTKKVGINLQVPPTPSVIGNTTYYISQDEKGSPIYFAKDASGKMQAYQER